MDLGALEDFNLVATHGGFGKASRASRRAKATLSRRVLDLEKSLGVRLLERGTRSLKLTEDGKTLFERTHGLLREIAEVGEILSAGLARPRGRLRVSSPVLLSQTLMGRIASRFAQAYPDIRIEVVAEDRPVDLVEDDYDVVIRINPSPDVNAVGRCFARDEMLVVAPLGLMRPDFARGADRSAMVPAVMSVNTPTEAAWKFNDGNESFTLRPEPRIRVSSLLMARDAVRAGLGAALLPRSIVGADIDAKRLVVWGTAADQSVELWVMHTSRRLASAKVSAFVDFICETFPDRVLTALDFR